MNTTCAYHLKANELNIEEAEVLRYLGMKKNQVSEEDKKPVRDIIAKALPFIDPKACYRRFPIQVYMDGRIEMPYGCIVSNDLTRNLSGCGEIFMIAATIGPKFDRELKRMHLTSMADAAVLQAVGATAVESLVDELNAHLADICQTEGLKLKPRYSAGYGDYTLENQKGIFKVLEPLKYTGITLMDTLIMAPEKSVTAIIGIYKDE